MTVMCLQVKRPDQQSVWQAARSSGAAPTYFQQVVKIPTCYNSIFSSKLLRFSCRLAASSTGG